MMNKKLSKIIQDNARMLQQLYDKGMTEDEKKAIMIKARQMGGTYSFMEAMEHFVKGEPIPMPEPVKINVKDLVGEEKQIL